MTKITSHQLYQSAEIARLRVEIEALKPDAESWRKFGKALDTYETGTGIHIASIEELKAFLGAVEGASKDQS